jgi:hypothetical protein
VNIMASYLPTTQEIKATVEKKLTLVGGNVSECVDDGCRLFLRALLPFVAKVRPKDVVNWGIALKTVDQEIQIRSYFFRQVCRNGAIMPQEADTQTIQRVDLAASSKAISLVTVQLLKALRASLDPVLFSISVRKMRLAAKREANRKADRKTNDKLLRLPMDLPISRFRQSRLLARIRERFLKDPDRSQFGLINAVTSVARDQRDPEIRWQLEEVGGSMLARIPIEPDDDEFGARLDGEQADSVGTAII